MLKTSLSARCLYTRHIVGNLHELALEIQVGDGLSKEILLEVAL